MIWIIRRFMRWVYRLICWDVPTYEDKFLQKAVPGLITRRWVRSGEDHRLDNEGSLK